MVTFGDVVKNANLVERDSTGIGIDRIVGLEHIDPENLHISRWDSPENGTSFTRKFIPGQTLFGKRRSYQRKVAFAEFEGICSGDILTFESKNPKILLPELLPFICQTDAFFNYALGTSAGSLSPRTSWSALQDFEFLLPPLDEQMRIAEILWAADEAGVQFEKGSTLLRSLQDAQILNLFRIPTTPQLVNLAGSICEKISVGIVVKPASYYVSEGGVPALRSLNVFPGRFDLTELVYISAYGSEKNKKTVLKKGDVVIVRTGRPGEANVVDTEQDGFNAIDLIIARPRSFILPDFLCAFINSTVAKRQFRRGIAGTAQTHFNIGEFKKLRIPVLPVNEQLSIVRMLNLYQHKLKDISTHLASLHELKKSIINSVIRGIAYD